MMFQLRGVSLAALARYYFQTRIQHPYGPAAVCLEKEDRPVWNEIDPSNGDLQLTTLKDRKDGQNDSDTSMSILLNWMTTRDNYTKYGGSKHGLKKAFFADQLAKSCYGRC
jgi:hypothetical protein